VGWGISCLIEHINGFSRSINTGNGAQKTSSLKYIRPPAEDGYCSPNMESVEENKIW
jgi:hypothetical protein